MERIEMYSASLEGNLGGEPAGRDIIDFLPPDYARNKRRRFPVDYASHSFSIAAEQWTMSFLSQNLCFQAGGCH